MKKIFFIFFLLLGFSSLTKDGMGQTSRSVLFTNATAHLGNGERIEKSAIGVENGLIKEVYNANVVDVKLLKYDTVIDLSGRHLYPGFIAMNSNLGLVEIGAVRASIDDDEVGEINPNIRSIVAYNAESKVTATVKTNGVLLAQVAPNGGLVSGSSSVVQLDAWNWEDALIKEDEGLHLNWPKTADRRNDKFEEINNKRSAKLKELKSFFENARAYNKVDFHFERNIKYESMASLFQGRQNLYIHTNYIEEITEAIYFCRDLGIEQIVIVGGYDAWRIPELISDNKVKVIFRRVHSLPMRQDEDINLPFKIPYKLESEGILYTLDVSGNMGPMQSRNLPFYAGTAMAHGLKEEEAVKAITLNAARILGIEKDYGSIEVGKSATIFVSEGNALDMRTNKVILAMIDGRWVDLNNHQKDLYQKYSKKYKQSQ